MNCLSVLDKMSLTKVKVVLLDYNGRCFFD